MKTVLLHVGRGKTGTTAIQAALAHQRQTLLAHGAHYVSAGGGASGEGHQQFAKSFISRLPRYMLPPIAPDQAKADVATELHASTCDTALLSSENFPLADIDALQVFFSNLSVKVRVILFVRSQDELLESEYNQMVKLKRETRTPQVYGEEAFDGADFYEEATKWERLVGRENLVCRVFDAGRGDVIKRFVSCLPSPDPAALAQALECRTSRTNESIGVEALCAVRLLNMVELDDRSAIYRTIFEHFAHSDMPAVLFDSAEARQFRARYSDSNLRFTSRYLATSLSDLGGRRYSDDERDAWRARIRALGLCG